MQSNYVTNEFRPLDQVRGSADLYKGDQSDRKTDTMMESDKTYEDTWYQGNKNTGGLNYCPLPPGHSLPHAWDKFGPVNQPKKFMYPKDFKAPEEIESASGTGLYLAYFTVDTSEHAFRYIKDLF